MKKIVLASLAILTACSAQVDVNALKNQIREELKKEASPSPAPSSTPSAAPTPQPTATPYQVPQETKEAVNQAIDALFALKSKTESGITYIRYLDEVSNTKAITDRAQRQKDFDKHPSATTIRKSIEHFSDAKDVWACYYTNDNQNNYISGVCTQNYGKKIEEEYFISPIDSSDYKKYELLKVISVMWQRAGMQAQYADQRK